MGVIGTFKVTGGKLLVTDPCYDLGTWCQGVLKNVHNGVWEASVELAGKRVGRLHVKAVGQVPVGPWFDQDFDVGVDSGQAGFFTHSKYPRESADDSAFYGRCCDATLSGRAGIIEGTGVVSQSGWGDGGYLCRTRRNKDDKLVEAEIVFIDEDEAELKECNDCGEKVAPGELDRGRCLACADSHSMRHDDDVEEL